MRRSLSSPVFWGGLILAVSQVVTLLVAFREKEFVEVNQFPSPQVALHLPIAYFFGAVVVIGAALFLIPVSKLRIIFRIVFVFLLSWGMFIVLGLTSPLFVAAPVALAAGLVWLFRPKVWLHNLFLLFALVSVGLVFGFLLSPWTAIAFMLVISVYDVLSVRFGYMMWMARRLSQSDVLPAFVIPRTIAGWNLSLREAGFKRLFEDRAEREFSILGGGDIGFPLLMSVSVFFAYGFAGASMVAAFSVGGLIAAYWIQSLFLKGRPMPALPPISVASLIGFLIVRFLF